MLNQLKLVTVTFTHFCRAGPGSGRAGFSKIPSRPVKKVSRPESRTEVSQQSRPESRPDPKIPSRPETPKIPKISMFFLKTKIKPQKTGETYYSVANTAHWQLITIDQSRLKNFWAFYTVYLLQNNRNRVFILQKTRKKIRWKKISGFRDGIRDLICPVPSRLEIWLPVPSPVPKLILLSRPESRPVPSRDSVRDGKIPSPSPALHFWILLV